MEKVSTGIKGLDEMLEGGLPKGRIILLCGGPGTGKTIFSLQFLMAAAGRGEPGVYVTLEEPLNLVKENISVFGWDLRAKEKDGLLLLLDFHGISYGEGLSGFRDREREMEESSSSILKPILAAVQTIKAKNIIIDPLTSVAIHEQRPNMKRVRIAEMLSKLRKTGCTSVLTSEVSTSGGDFYVEEFLADGVIKLEKVLQNFSLINTLRIEKMRGLDYDDQPRRYAIDNRGLTVFNTEQVRIRNSS